uniref:Uncharacterized protein n=1 Tax=Helicotheca tamesis TaxID=374047 RepID=A0A7S2MN30_9STRA
MVFQRNDKSTKANNHNRQESHRNFVQFVHITKIYVVPGLSEYTTKEIEATWVTREDNANILVDTLKTVKRMRKGKAIDDEKYSTRGLEQMDSAACLEQRKMNKASVLNAVIAEQRRQKLLGYYDPMKLCDQSRLHSASSRDDALRLGASDAIAAGLQPNPTISKILHSLEVETKNTKKATKKKTATPMIPKAA